MKKAILFLVLAGMFASCSKSTDDNSPIDASKTKLLMDGRWELKNYMVNPNLYDSNSTYMDAYTPIPGCIKDNYYIFQSSTTVILYEGVAKCDLASPDSVIMGYQLTNFEKHIRWWSNVDDPENSVFLDGEITYPSIDSFMVKYTTYDSASTLTTGHEKTFVKIPF